MTQDAKQGEAGVLNPADSQGARDARANVGRSHGLAVICMVCMLILAYLTPNRGPFNVFTAVAGVLVALAFAYCYPFSRTAPTPAIPKAAAVWEAVAGLVLTMIVTSAFAWLALMGLVTALMVISAFLAELLREKRLHLISSLGTTLLAGGAGLATAGWGVFPSPRGLGPLFSAHPLFAWVSTIVTVVFLVALMGVAALWVKEESPAVAASSGWAGVAMLPVMISGAFPLLLSVAALLWL